MLIKTLSVFLTHLFDKIGHCMGSIVFFDNIFILFRGQIACLLCDNRKALFGMISFFVSYPINV